MSRISARKHRDESIFLGRSDRLVAVTNPPLAAFTIAGPGIYDRPLPVTRGDGKLQGIVFQDSIQPGVCFVVAQKNDIFASQILPRDEAALRRPYGQTGASEKRCDVDARERLAHLRL